MTLAFAGLAALLLIWVVDVFVVARAICDPTVDTDQALDALLPAVIVAPLAAMVLVFVAALVFSGV